MLLSCRGDGVGQPERACSSRARLAAPRSALRTMAQRFVGQPGGKTAFDKRHSDDSLAPAAQLQRRETSKRLVSWEGSNQLALLDSDYKAAHCRRYTGRATVREPTFSLREFCKAYAYETLPPVLDLAAASLLEGSLAKG